jgi:hypothetical protein
MLIKELNIKNDPNSKHYIDTHNLKTEQKNNFNIDIFINDIT